MEVDLLGKTVHEVAAYLTDELNFPESDVAELTRMFGSICRSLVHFQTNLMTSPVILDTLQAPTKVGYCMCIVCVHACLCAHVHTHNTHPHYRPEPIFLE